MKYETSRFGKNLELRRINASMSVADLAERAGFSPKSIRSYELGRTTPSLQGAVTLAAALGVTVNDLLLVEPFAA